MASITVTIPVSGESKTVEHVTRYFEQTYPVWATRPMLVEVSSDGAGAITIGLSENGGTIYERVLPLTAGKQVVDLSFTGLIFTRFDRQVNADMKRQVIDFKSGVTAAIRMNVCNIDVTYWMTRGVPNALPQPPKPVIYNHTYDLIFPFTKEGRNKTFNCEVVPVDNAPMGQTYPNTITIGTAFNCTNIKQIKIKDFYTTGIDYVINYENRVFSEVMAEESAQCAARVSWTMRNGEMFWFPVKSYYWDNKFTYLRGRGGVTEQAELTLNLEYGKEYYAVFQELAVSSCILCEMNIDGIMQYPVKRFKLENTMNTGARWSGSNRVYRQQMKFKTIDLQDNYEFPAIPTPEVPAVSITQSTSTSNVDGKAQRFAFTITANTDYVLDSYPDWMEFKYEENPDATMVESKPVWRVGVHPFYMNATANNTGARTGNIVIRQKGGSKTITHVVNQSGGNPISVLPTVLNFPSSGAVLGVQVSSSDNWEVSYVPSWANAYPGSWAAGTKEVLICAKPTDSATSAVDYIDFENGTAQQTASLDIIQLESPSNPVAMLSQSLPDTVSSTSGVHTTTLWSLGDYDIRDVSPGLTINGTSGEAGESPITIIWAANTRQSGRPLYFSVVQGSSGETTRFCTLQDSSTGTTDGEVFPYDFSEVPDTGEAYKVRVVCPSYRWGSNIPADMRSWISFYPSSGNMGVTECIMWVKPNTTGEQRFGNVDFDFSGIDSAQISVIQM